MTGFSGYFPWNRVPVHLISYTKGFTCRYLLSRKESDVQVRITFSINNTCKITPNNVIPLQNSPEWISLLPIASGVDFSATMALRRMAISTDATQWNYPYWRSPEADPEVIWSRWAATVVRKLSEKYGRDAGDHRKMRSPAPTDRYKLFQADSVNATILDR